MPNGPLKTDNQIYLGNQLETEQVKAELLIVKNYCKVKQQAFLCLLSEKLPNAHFANTLKV